MKDLYRKDKTRQPNKRGRVLLISGLALVAFSMVEFGQGADNVRGVALLLGFPLAVMGVLVGLSNLSLAATARSNAKIDKANAERKARIAKRHATAAADISEWRNAERTPATVYVTEFPVNYDDGTSKTYTKVGISKGTDGKRVRQHERKGHRRVKSWTVPSMAVARAVEREVLDWTAFSTGFVGKRDAAHLAHLLPQGGHTELTTIPSAELVGAVEKSIHHFTTESVPA